MSKVGGLGQQARNKGPLCSCNEMLCLKMIGNVARGGSGLTCRQHQPKDNASSRTHFKERIQETQEERVVEVEYKVFQSVTCVKKLKKKRCLKMKVRLEGFMWGCIKA